MADEKRHQKREDGRRQMLFYLKEQLIPRVKRKALAEGRPAYEIAEDALEEYLKVHGDA